MWNNASFLHYLCTTFIACLVRCVQPLLHVGSAGAGRRLEILVLDYQVANWHKSAELFEEQRSTSFDEMSPSG